MTSTAARRKSQSRWHATAGMTLIEMLVALAIFAVLGVMGYRAAATAMDGRQRVAAETQRWREIANLVQILETDITQYAQRPGAAGMANPTASSLQLQTTASGVELGFLKLDGSGGNVRRRGYRFAEGRLTQLRWPGTDPVAVPDAYVVLEDVAAMRCTLMSADGQRYTTWPDMQSSRAATLTAIDIEVDLPDAGTIRRLIALR
jgi:general secretion pathway protein J